MAPPIVRTISRYLLRQHVAPLGFALAALTSLMLIQQIAKQLSSLLGKGLPTSVIVEVFLLSFLWNDQLLPRTNHQLRTLQMDIQRKKPSLALKEQVINEVVAGQFFLRAARIDGSANKLKDGDIEEVSRTDPTQFNRTFFNTNRMRVAGVANTFQPTTTDSYKSDREMSTCEMQEQVDAARRDVESATTDAHLVIENDLRRLAGLAPLPPRTSAATARDPKRPGPYCRALERLAAWLLPAEAGAQTPRPTPRGAPQAPPPPHASPRPLPPSAGRAAPITPPYVVASLITPGAGVSEQQRLRAARERVAAYEVEIQKKYAIAVACLVFALVGAPIALRFQRGGVGLVLGVSVAVFTVYYIGLIGGEELGDRLIVSPFFAMWTPNVIFALAGLFGLWRIRKPGNSPHGGDWSDLWPAWIGGGGPWRPPR